MLCDYEQVSRVRISAGAYRLTGSCGCSLCRVLTCLCTYEPGGQRRRGRTPGRRRRITNDHVARPASRGCFPLHELPPRPLPPLLSCARSHSTFCSSGGRAFASCLSAQRPSLCRRAPRAHASRGRCARVQSAISVRRSMVNTEHTREPYASRARTPPPRMLGDRRGRQALVLPPARAAAIRRPQLFPHPVGRVTYGRGAARVRSGSS